MKKAAILIGLLVVLACAIQGQAQEKVFRIGIVGLDISSSIGFTEYINNPENKTGCKVIAGYPGGSADIAVSVERMGKFPAKLRDDFGLEIMDDITELCAKVDGVLVESMDGRSRLERVKLILAAKKPVFIDKPLAGNLADVLEIFKLAKEAGVPCWSSSSLRFSPGMFEMRTKYGDVLGCSAYSPCSMEEHHPDLYWYGIHGVETLITIMGPGCKTVQRAHTKDYDYVIGIWNDGRIGTYRGLREGKKDYGAMVFGTNGIGPSGPYAGLNPLAEQIVKFFKTGVVPVPEEETIEIYAFMTAADESKAQNGAAVSLESVIEKAKMSLKK
jgi:predicted dehydrogenase